MRTTWAKLKREDIRPDEGKQLQEYTTAKEKHEDGTELRLLDPSTLNQAETAQGKLTVTNDINESGKCIILNKYKVLIMLYYKMSLVIFYVNTFFIFQ